MDSAARFPVAPPPGGGFVRALPNVYEVNAFGGTYSTVPAGAWQRGQIVRQYQPTVHLSPPVPMFDPTHPPGGAN